MSLHRESLHRDELLIRPWRIAAIAAGAIAAVELVLLVVVGGALVARPSTTAHRAHKAAKAAPAAAAKTPVVSAHHVTPAAAAHLSRSRTTVLVLNGNGRRGAAAATARRVSGHGYRIGGVANAPRMDFTRSLVMYRRGFEGEGRRLAHDLGIGIVGPLDGMKTSQLHGANAVVVVGR